MSMSIQVSGVTEGNPIPDRHALCGLDGMGPNISPAVSWEGTPDGAASIVVLCIDIDAPTVADDVNKEGRRVPAELPRGHFGHWSVIDIPTSVSEIAEGTAAHGVVAGGKAADSAPVGRSGVNDYTSWFAGDAEMEGQYFGYDGPCPPANDDLVHRYTFSVHALDIATLDLDGAFTTADVVAAIDGHVLDSAEVTGTYTLDPTLR